MHGIYAHSHFDDLDLDARSQWVGKGKKYSVELSRLLSKQISIKLAAMVGPFLCDLDFAKEKFVYMA